MVNSNSNSNSNFNSSEFYQLNTSNDNNTSFNANSHSPELNSTTMESIQVDIDMNNSTSNNLNNSNSNSNSNTELNLIDELNNNGGIGNNSNFSEGEGNQFGLNNRDRDYWGEEEDEEDIYNSMGLRSKTGLIGEVKGYEADITSECKLRVSSYKYGYPPSEMIDNSLETYWQSEGQLPHTIILKYSRQILLSKIKIYFDFPMDESYTPNLFTIGLTNRFNDYKELTKVQGEATPKWIEINCKLFNNNKPIPTFNIKLKILNNMEDGRDSHIRQIRIFELKDFDDDNDKGQNFENLEKLVNKRDKGNIEVFNLGGFSGLEKIRI